MFSMSFDDMADHVHHEEAMDTMLKRGYILISRSGDIHRMDEDGVHLIEETLGNYEIVTNG